MPTTLITGANRGLGLEFARRYTERGWKVIATCRARGRKIGICGQAPSDYPEFAQFLRLMREHANIWSKVSCPERLSKSGPPGYDDVVPFARHLVEAFPDRVLWGTDWPHPNMKTHMPDDGKLVDYVPRIAAAALSHAFCFFFPSARYPTLKSARMKTASSSTSLHPPGQPKRGCRSP